MKTAISIPNPLFEIIEDYARKEKVSRSEVFVRAVREFFAKHRNKKLLDQLNAVYSQDENKEETQWKQNRNQYQRKNLVKHSPW
jgi:metal-responsive CopG/Arc/MetJ family transcriptional regulator